MQKEKKYTNPNDLIVEETIKLFETVNMGVAKLYGNKTERRDVLILHNKLKEKLPLVIAFLGTYNDSLKPNKAGKVFGKVIKPSELLFRLQDVFDAKRKLDRQLQYELQKEAVAKKEREDAELLKKERDSYTLEEKEKMRKKSEDMLKLIRGF